MTKLFIVPAVGSVARRHYEDSVVAGVEPSVLRPLQTGTRKTIVAGAVDGRVRAWGAFKSMIRQWSLLEPGDLCLFYTQGQTFTLCGRVSGRVESDVVAEAIWGRARDDRAWSLMWFFDRLVPVNAPGVFVRDELVGSPATFAGFDDQG